MSKIYVLQNADNGKFYGGDYGARYCKPTDSPSSDYSAWTSDIGKVVQYKKDSVQGQAKRLTTEFKKVLTQLQDQADWFTEKIASPDPKSYGGSWHKENISMMKDHRSSHEQAHKLIKDEQPSKIDAVELTIDITNVRQI